MILTNLEIKSVNKFIQNLNRLLHDNYGSAIVFDGCVWQGNDSYLMSRYSATKKIVFKQISPIYLSL